MRNYNSILLWAAASLCCTTIPTPIHAQEEGPSLSPRNVDNSVSAISASEDGQTVFSVIRGQLLASEDGGYTWQRRMKNLLSCGGNSGSNTYGQCGGSEMQYLVVSPNYNRDTTVYFGSMQGLMKSIDGGHNWKPLGGDQFDHCKGKGHVSVSPEFGSKANDNDDLMLVVGKDLNSIEDVHYLYRSIDGGETFAAVDLTQAVSNGGSLYGCAALFSDSQDVHFLGTNTGDLLASLDQGVTWNKIFQVGERIKQIVGSRYHHTSLVNGLVDEHHLYLLTPHFLVHLILERKHNDQDGFTIKDSRPLLEHERNNFLHLEAHSPSASLLPSLFVLSSADQEETTPLLVSPDNGDHWYQGDIVTTSPNNHYMDVSGVPNTNIVYLGTDQGIFRTDDKGQTWKYLNAMSGWITSLSIGPSYGQHWYFIDFCTFARGCFGGRIQVNPQDFSGFPSQLLEPPYEWYSQEQAIDETRANAQKLYHETIAVSPRHHKDKVVLRTTSLESNAERLQRSFNNFAQGSIFSFLPALDDSLETIVQDIAFSPNFIKDNSIYVGGTNLGLLKSTNQAETFELVWDASDADAFQGTVTSIAISPKFHLDQTMAVLVYSQNDPKYDPRPFRNVFLSQDQGTTWRKISSGPVTEFVHLVAFLDTDNMVQFLAVHFNGYLHIWTGLDGQWQPLEQRPYYGFPGGFAHNGLVAHKRTVMASLERGGIIHFQDFDAATLSFTKSTPNIQTNFTDTVTVPDMKFVFHGDELTRGVGDLVAFSPNYTLDDTLFAASFYSLYVSFDSGIIWHEFFRLPHNNYKSLPITPEFVEIDNQQAVSKQDTPHATTLGKNATNPFASSTSAFPNFSFGSYDSHYDPTPIFIAITALLLVGLTVTCCWRFIVNHRNKQAAKKDAWQWHTRRHRARASKAANQATTNKSKGGDGNDSSDEHSQTARETNFDASFNDSMGCGDRWVSQNATDASSPVMDPDDRKLPPEFMSPFDLHGNSAKPKVKMPTLGAFHQGLPKQPSDIDLEIH